LNTAKTYKWYKLIDNESLLSWQSNNMSIAEVNGKKVTVARYNNHLFAFAHKCPHAGAVMADGYIDAAKRQKRNGRRVFFKNLSHRNTGRRCVYRL